MNCQDVVLYVCMDTGRYQSPLCFHFTVTHEKETACTCAADLSWVSDRCRMAPFLDALRYKFSSSESIVRVLRASASMSPWSPFHLHSAAPMFDVRSCFPCVPPKILEPWSGREIFQNTLKNWELDYSEKKSLTSEESFLVNVKKIKKKIKKN